MVGALIIITVIGGRSYRCDLSKGQVIAIPLLFNAPQPNSYDLPAATANSWGQSGFIGDVRRGGSCNFDEVCLVPHCNGTHTECVGHISHERISILSIPIPALIPTTLVSVTPETASLVDEHYTPTLEEADRCITARAVKTALSGADPAFTEALVIRTLPNGVEKLSMRYIEHPPPFFTREAIEFLKFMKLNHLLVDIPSLDRTFDQGLLTAHHLYWDVTEGSHEVDPTSWSRKTITEFIYVASGLSDGRYLLNLQVAPFQLDAAPSRPILYPIEEVAN